MKVRKTSSGMYWAGVCFQFRVRDYGLRVCPTAPEGAPHMAPEDAGFPVSARGRGACVVISV